MENLRHEHRHARGVPDRRRRARGGDRVCGPGDRAWMAAPFGTLPPIPDTVGTVIVPAMRGLYVGSTLAPSWQDRIAVGDLGYRTKAVLTRYPEGIMLQRSGGHPIWIPDESITAIRTERGIAGKALTHQGILAIRWRLPSGTEIDTGFRGDNRTDYSQWVGEEAA